MDTIERLIALADLYIDLTGLKPTTVSLRAFHHTAKLGALRSGSDIRVRFAEEAFKWFAANWPKGEPLPVMLTDWCAINFAEALARRAADAGLRRSSQSRA
jgi:hypothetical protein